MNVPLVKRVAAYAGDRVCASGLGIFVNGRRVAERRVTDRMGRPMPMWEGCTVLRGRQLFLLMDHPRSEEHTSELQSLMRISYAVFCLKKKKKKHKDQYHTLHKITKHIK